MPNIAIIPARGGSKRIPKKNIREFYKKPIIAYAIEAAQKTGCFHEIMVSTDCEETAKISCDYGANVPFLRSKKNSDDLATSAAVLQEVLAEYANRKSHFDIMCCIYPTAAFITPDKLLTGYTALKACPHMDVAFTVVRYSTPIQRAFQIKNNVAEMMCPENISSRSQDLEPAYYDAGQFYWLKVSSFLKKPLIFAERSIPIILQEMEVQDIDSEEDWKIAELKFELWKKSRHH
ncbi:MAG: pseudaminic acid cytidylyltransferase [Chthoniobacterales bacterium]